jgi:hypothetical protein
MEQKKSACVIYVAKTKAELPHATRTLNSEGFEVCAVLATVEVAQTAQSGGDDLPPPVRACIANSELCVFLIPAEDQDDEGIGQAASLAAQMGRRVIGLVSGDRAEYPEGFRTANSVIRIASERFSTSVHGTDVWETPDNEVLSDRTIHHQKCQ